MLNKFTILVYSSTIIVGKNYKMIPKNEPIFCVP